MSDVENVNRLKTERMTDERLAAITAHYGADPTLSETVQMADEVQHLRLQLTASASRIAELEALEVTLYDGHAVFTAMNPVASRRTSPENVSDVLDALSRCWRANLAKGEAK